MADRRLEDRQVSFTSYTSPVKSSPLYSSPLKTSPGGVVNYSSQYFNGNSPPQELAQLAKVTTSPFKINSSFRSSAVSRQPSSLSIPIPWASGVCENCKPVLQSAYSDFESQKKNDQNIITNLMAERDDCLECMKSGDVPVENIPDFY